MAIEQVGPDQRFTTIAIKRSDGFVVHRDDDPFTVTDCDGEGDLLKVTECCWKKRVTQSGYRKSTA